MTSEIVKSGVYFIVNVGTGTVVDLDNGSSAEGTKVQGFQKRELSDVWVPAQLWVISQVGDDPIYTIQNTNSRTYMTLTGSTNQTPVQGFPANNTDSQKWVINRAKNGTSYVIANQATGTYVDLFNGNAANGTAINGWAGSGVNTTNPHQLWRIVHA